jgi:hypothetical protein
MMSSGPGGLPRVRYGLLVAPAFTVLFAEDLEPRNNFYLHGQAEQSLIHQLESSSKFAKSYGPR